MDLSEFTVEEWKGFVRSTISPRKMLIDVTYVDEDDNTLKTDCLKGGTKNFDEIYVDAINVDEKGYLHLCITVLVD